MLESNLSTLNCVYFALFFVGVGYALFVVLTGGLSDIDMPDVDIDIPQIDLPGDVDIPGADIHIGAGDVAAGGIDAPDVSVSPLSPITIATFITTFGGVGVLCLQLFEVSPRHEPGLVSGRGAWCSRGSCTCSTASSSSAPRDPASCAGANSSDSRPR